MSSPLDGNGMAQKSVKPVAWTTDEQLQRLRIDRMATVYGTARGGTGGHFKFPHALYPASALTAQAAELATLKARIVELEAGLEAILRHGELANVPTGSPFASYGGKKPPSKDVFVFPRHMLTGIEAVLARRLTHQEKNNGR